MRASWVAAVRARCRGFQGDTCARRAVCSSAGSVCRAVRVWRGWRGCAQSRALPLRMPLAAELLCWQARHRGTAICSTLLARGTMAASDIHLLCVRRVRAGNERMCVRCSTASTARGPCRGMCSSVLALPVRALWWRMIIGTGNYHAQMHARSQIVQREAGARAARRVIQMRRGMLKCMRVTVTARQVCTAGATRYVVNSHSVWVQFGCPYILSFLQFALQFDPVRILIYRPHNHHTASHTAPLVLGQAAETDEAKQKP